MQFLRHAAESALTVKGITYSPDQRAGGQYRVPGWLTTAAGENEIPDLNTLVIKSHEQLEKVT